MNDYYIAVDRGSYYIAHHGVIGQKWGVRRYQNADGTLTSLGKKKRQEGFTIKKGTTVGRITRSLIDKTYDNKKYVSITPQDHYKWNKYLGDGYGQMGEATYQVFYDSVKDLKVAGVSEQEKRYSKMFIDKHSSKKVKHDQEYADKFLGVKPTTDIKYNIGRQIAAQTDTAHKFVKDLMDSGYDAIVDTHGTNVSELPVIVFNPDQNLKRREKDNYYTDYVKDYIKKQSARSA